MELSDKERERIIAEEKVRFETKRQLWKDAYSGHSGGGYCGGWGMRRGGFWKGLLVGLILAWIGSAWCRHWGASCPFGAGSYGMMGKSCHQGMMWDNDARVEPPAPPADKK